MPKLTELELESMFDDMLNDVYGEVQIAGFKFGTAHAFYRVDPIQYRHEMHAYADGLIRDGYEIEGY